MAALANPHWEAVPDNVRRVLPMLGRAANLTPFYLAGGTALALRLGHRISVDLDFFGQVETFDDAWQRRIIAELSRTFRVGRPSTTPFGLNVVVDGVELGLLTYGYTLLEPTDTIVEIQLASLSDIGWMKLEAIVDRGLRKDFYDLFFVTRYVSLDELFQKQKIKYPYWHNFAANVLTALDDFEIAERQADPTLLQPVQWDEIKKFFAAEVTRLSHLWLDKK